MADQQEDQAPGGVLQQNVESEPDLGDQAEQGESGEAAEIDGNDRRIARFQPPQEHGEPDAEEEGEDPPGLLLHEDPDAPADQILEAGNLDPHLLVEVHQDHAEQREPAQNVQRVQAIIGGQRGGSRRACGDGGMQLNSHGRRPLLKGERRLK